MNKTPAARPATAADKTPPSGKAPAVALWRQLQALAPVVAAVRAGASGTAALEAVAVDLRPGVQALAFAVWRNAGRAWALRQHLAQQTPPPALDALLCSALALLWDPAQARYDAFTLVNQAVEAAKRTPALRRQAGFLNACLRRFLREREALVAATQNDVQALWNHPAWWVARLQQDHPAHWQALLTQANTPAPMVLRVNVRQHRPEDYLALLAQQGMPARLHPHGAVELLRPVAVQQLPGFAQGAVSVQDSAAQWAAGLLLDGLESAPGKALRILDACAAPGGKTGHLLERSEAQVIALEIDPQRSQRIQDNLLRLGLYTPERVALRIADAGQPAQWWDGQAFDGVLLDAPCTASGIVRRHPDVRWLRRASDVDNLAAQQRALLAALWPLVRPGGRLLYCTCSVFVAEGRGQIEMFLAHHTDAVLLPSPGHFLPSPAENAAAVPDNQSAHHDGFFYALLSKNPL